MSTELDRPEVFGADEQTDIDVDLPRWVALARFVLAQERIEPDVEMSLIFVDVATITDLNERFLGGNGPTDVLAFPIDDEVVAGGRQPDLGGRGPGSSGEPLDPPIVIGDVIVCPQIASTQAMEHSKSVDEEIALLVVHGVLHLLAYDHAEPPDATKMQAREREILERFGEIETETTS